MSVTQPVLFLIFNRPEYTRESLAAIREAKPKKLYIAADGPREGRDGEKELCEETRNLVLNSIDWECDIKTRFQEKNLGCYLEISSAVSWFFENEEMGIILEDDIVANLSFFKCCGELLEKYKDEKRIWTIGGYNYPSPMDISESFYFARNFSCWGWATWANRWKPYSLDLTDYSIANLKNIDHELARRNWAEILSIMQSDNPIDSWAYRYIFRGIEHKALHMIASKNMCKNIGSFGTHSDGDWACYHMPTFEIENIIHPERIELNKEIQFILDESYYKNAPTPFPIILGIPKERELFFWGTGRDAVRALWQIKSNDYKVTAFVDSNTEMRKKKFNGYNVISPKELFDKKLKSYFVVIASTKYANEIVNELEKNGLVIGIDYWSPN